MLIDADKLSETKKYHTVGTIPKSNIKIYQRIEYVEKDQIYK